MIYGKGWLESNRDFIARTLTVDYVNAKVPQAVAMLKDHPQHDLATKLLQDLPECQELLAHRVRELPELLANLENAQWSV